MTILATNRLIFNWLCICPSTQETSLKRRLLAKLLTVYTLFIGLLTLIASIMIIFKKAKSDVNSSLYALIQVFPITCSLLLLIYGHINHYKLEGIFVKLQEIYESKYFRKFQNCSILTKKNHYRWKF